MLSYPRPRRPGFGRGLRRAARAAALAAAMAVTAAPPAGAGSPPAAAAEAAGLARTHDAFCAVVQRRFTGTTLPVRNTLHTGWEPFVDSKPRVQPLETQQYVTLAEGVPVRLSCKTKTADHIAAVHGPRALAGSAVTARSCRDINREIVLAAWRGLSAEQRAAAPLPPTRLMLDPDRMRLTGSGWVSDYTMVYAAADGRVHVQAQGLHADWEDWRWKLAPESWRGTRYCHLLAPEHARRLMLGEVTAAPRPPV
jgi:hypothetical protein